MRYLFGLFVCVLVLASCSSKSETDRNEDAGSVSESDFNSDQVVAVDYVSDLLAIDMSEEQARCFAENTVAGWPVDGGFDSEDRDRVKTLGDTLTENGETFGKNAQVEVNFDFTDEQHKVINSAAAECLEDYLVNDTQSLLINDEIDYLNNADCVSKGFEEYWNEVNDPERKLYFEGYLYVGRDKKQLTDEEKIAFKDIYGCSGNAKSDLIKSFSAFFNKEGYPKKTSDCIVSKLNSWDEEYLIEFYLGGNEEFDSLESECSGVNDNDNSVDTTRPVE